MAALACGCLSGGPLAQVGGAWQTAHRSWYLAQLEVVPHGGAVDGYEDRKDVLEAVALL